MECQQMTFLKELEPAKSRSYPEVSRANLTALLENVELLMTSVICGPNSCESFGRLNPDGSLEKTCQGCSQATMEGFSGESCETWPSGGLMFGGTLFRLTPLERAFGVSEWPLWPRPLASDGEAWIKNRKEDPMRSIWSMWERGKQDRPIYYHIWNGLSPCQSADAQETMMGFPKGWTELNA